MSDVISTQILHGEIAVFVLLGLIILMKGEKRMSDILNAVERIRVHAETIEANEQSIMAKQKAQDDLLSRIAAAVTAVIGLLTSGDTTGALAGLQNIEGQLSQTETEQAATTADQDTAVTEAGKIASDLEAAAGTNPPTQ